MRRVRVKVCGNMRLQDVEYAAKVGVDALGFIVGFPSSPRNLTPDQAYELMRHVPPFIDRVVVTRDDPSILRKVAEKLPVDCIQIIGDSPYSPSLRELLSDIRLIKVIHVDTYAASRAVEAARHYDAVLLDSVSDGMPGGTGRTHDWLFSRLIVEVVEKPVILAGGLTPENIEEAVRSVKPYAVDVSSGVESKPGLKDPLLVERFVERAKGVPL